MCKSLKKACNTSKSCLHLNIWKSHIFRYLCYSIRWMYNRFFSVTSLETTNVKPGGVEKKSRYLKICQEIRQTSHNTVIFPHSDVAAWIKSDRWLTVFCFLNITSFLLYLHSFLLNVLPLLLVHCPVLFI